MGGKDIFQWFMDDGCGESFGKVFKQHATASCARVQRKRSNHRKCRFQNTFFLSCLHVKYRYTGTVYLSARTEKPGNDHPLSCRFRTWPIPRSLGCKPGSFFQLKGVVVPQNIPKANCATMNLPKNGWLGRRAGEECVMKCHCYCYQLFTTKWPVAASPLFIAKNHHGCWRIEVVIYGGHFFQLSLRIIPQKNHPSSENDCDPTFFFQVEHGKKFKILGKPFFYPVTIANPGTPKSSKITRVVRTES